MPGKVHYEATERVATITLDNPSALNGFDNEMCQELKKIWTSVEKDPAISCAILTGAGEKAFCTGWDVSSLSREESEQLVPGENKFRFRVTNEAGLSAMLLALFAGWMMSGASVREELGLRDGPVFRLWQWSARVVAPLAVALVFVTNLA